MSVCPLCDTEQATITVPTTKPFVRHYKCSACGEYEIVGSFTDALKNEPYKSKKYILSGIFRESSNRGVILTLDIATVDEILDMVSIPDSPLESIDRILLYIYKNIVSADDFFLLRPLDYSIAFAKNQNEFRFFLDKTVKLGYLEREGFKFRLTLEGWKNVNELRKTQVISNQAFVAMWFAEEMQEVYFNGFKPALKATGYDPIRIDLFPHNKKIDDEIIAKIRRSGILVADFTGNRGGVYFEAGFAMGLGIPVIWTCRKDFISNLHFDTRQYSHIMWENPEDLKDQLIYRIKATIPEHKIKS